MNKITRNCCALHKSKFGSSTSDFEKKLQGKIARSLKPSGHFATKSLEIDIFLTCLPELTGTGS